MFILIRKQQMDLLRSCTESSHFLTLSLFSELRHFLSQIFV